MCPDLLRPLGGNRGIGLMTAIFTIVILALFGVLMARYTVTSQTSSAEDYLWAQALYSAESTVRLNILSHDGGGGLSGVVTPYIQNFDFTDKVNPPVFGAPNAPSTITVQATHLTGVSRTVEVKYILE